MAVFYFFWGCRSSRKGENYRPCFFCCRTMEQLWSQELIDLFPLKIFEVQWDWWQSLGSVNMAPWWPGSIWTAPSGPLIRMVCVITKSSTEEVKTSSVFEGQAYTHSGIFPPLCEDHGSATCQPRLNSCPSGQGETSIIHYLEPNSERGKSCGHILFLANSFPLKTSLLQAFLSVFPEAPFGRGSSLNSSNFWQITPDSHFQSFAPILRLLWSNRRRLTAQTLQLHEDEHHTCIYMAAKEKTHT